MSDYDDDFMGEDEDYDLEYSEDSNSEPDVDLENQYYNSKALKVRFLQIMCMYARTLPWMVNMVYTPPPAPLLTLLVIDD